MSTCSAMQLGAMPCQSRRPGALLLADDPPPLLRGCRPGMLQNLKLIDIGHDLTCREGERADADSYHDLMRSRFGKWGGRAVALAQASGLTGVDLRCMQG